MTPEQQTPASVVERLTYILSLVDDGPALWSHGSRQSTSVSYGDLRAILATVERLSAEREGLREALEPFGAGEWGDLLPPDTPIFPAQAHAPTGIVAGDFRRARAALTQGESRQTGAELTTAIFSVSSGVGYNNLGDVIRAGLRALGYDRPLQRRTEQIVSRIAALTQTGVEPVGAAEREVGRAVYERIETLIGGNSAELDYLSDLVSSVEEYGSYSGPVHPLPAAPTPADGGGE